MSPTASRNTFLIYGLMLFLINECQAVKINSIEVPSVYELSEDSKTLKLDCDFTVEQNETGFVLKWLHNSAAVFQWIPSKKGPSAVGSFKGRVDTETVNSDDRYKKHSALIIPKPLLNDSGVYSCSVQTFQSSDKKSANLLIIDPADSVDLTYRVDPIEDLVTIDCHIKNIFPLPEVKLIFENDDEDLITESFETLNEGGNYNVHVTVKVKKNLIKDDSAIKCVVKVPDSSYEVKASVEYNDPMKTASTKKTIFGELTKFVHTEAEATNENFASRLECSLTALFLSIAAIMISSH